MKRASTIELREVTRRADELRERISHQRSDRESDEDELLKVELYLYGLVGDMLVACAEGEAIGDNNDLVTACRALGCAVLVADAAREAL